MIATPGHGKSRFRVKANIRKGSGEWEGYAQYRKFIFWLDIKYIPFGPDSMSILRQGVKLIEQFKIDSAQQKQKEVTYL